MNILRAIDDPAVFGRHFLDLTSWQAWRAFLAALFGHGMTDDEVAIYRECTGRSEIPTGPSSEAWLVCGRRAGKSFILALVAVFLACFRDYRAHLGPGERATVMVIAADRRQARVIMRYVKGLLEAVPMLSRTVDGETQESVDLQNRVTIEVHTTNFRTVRGYAIAAALCDEIAFWPTDYSANPDTEILAALRPAMATIPNAVLLCASSPYARRGALWKAYRCHHGQSGRVLVWQASTRRMNPSVPQDLIDAAYADDPASATAEYGAEFRSDIKSYISREAVEACVTRGLRERPKVDGIVYRAFVDPSGGSSDSMTLAIAHAEDEQIIVDAVRECRPPFSPEATVDEFASLLKSYGVHTIAGDRYAGEWPREQFGKRGIAYRLAAKVRSDLYRDLLPLLNSGRVDLLDHDRLVSQISNLERRATRAGRDSIDHPPGSHDDVANAVAGVVKVVGDTFQSGGKTRVGTISGGCEGRITWENDEPRQRTGIRVVSYGEKEQIELREKNQW